MSYNKESDKLHEQKRGKIRIKPTVNITSKRDLSNVYSPGVSSPSQHIAENPEDVYKYTSKKRNVAIVTDGTAVLGLGNIGSEASIPVMEGKAALFKQFANIDGYPLPVNTDSVEQFVTVAKAITPYFNGINLEDIRAPECFTILKELKDIDIPVFHDDQHGTAIIVLTGLLNALELTNRTKETNVVINGAGAAGIATAHILHEAGFTDITVLDSKGIVSTQREDMNKYKVEIAKKIQSHKKGSLEDVLGNAAVFIGVSVGNILDKTHVKLMEDNPIIFALANPTPEIDPMVAEEAGASIIATGRSDYPNQINNAVVFPGLFNGLIEAGKKNVTYTDMIRVAEALRDIEEVTPQNIIPSILNEDVVPAVTKVFTEKA